MSIAKQKELIEKSGELGLPIPGLSITPIIAAIAKNSAELKAYYKAVEDERKENEERGMDKEQAKKEAKEKTKEILKKFKETIKQFVIEQIALIKQQYKIFMDGLKRIPADVKTAIMNIALPPAISVPPGAPNPLYALNIASQTKNALAGTLGIIILAFTEILKAATKIEFVLPEPLLVSFEQIKIAATVVNSIPV
jgi:hypothetical protein